MSRDLFVDNHCHLFNIVDIPLYATLEGKLEMSTLKKFAFGLGLTIGSIPLFLAGTPKSKLKETEEFLRFFEREISSNIKWLTEQIHNTVPADTDVLLTPLVMDFDLVDKNAKSGLDEPNAERQLNRLVKAIKETKAKTYGIKLCPFMGFDLRKLHNEGGLKAFQKIWKKYSPKGEIDSYDDLKSADVIGIKLYPPLGFNPYSRIQKNRVKYIEFYKWCCDNDIPITAHCQMSSFSPTKSSAVKRNTRPANWWHLLQDNKELQSLRINFAHFGGEDGVEDMFDWAFDGIDESSWTYDLIKLLKKYPNTYADVSAYDFADEDACDNINQVLTLDADGKFDKHGQYQLKDKLLWGSDVPMVISDESYREDGDKDAYAAYKYFFKKFKNTISFYKDMTGENSKQFLKLK